MPNELILADDPKRIELPSPQHDGAKLFMERAHKLTQILPDGIAARQFITSLITEVNSTALKSCTTESVLKSAFNLTVLGLTPGAQLGHAHLVPFKTRGVAQCQVVIGYKGWLELAYGCDFLRDVQCEVVLKGEAYRRWNTIDGAQIEHEIPVDRDESWANVQAAYCVWHSKGGGRGVSVVGKDALDKLKKRGNVWSTHPIPMAMKTALIRAAKSWQLTTRMGQAITMDDMAEAGKDQPSLSDETNDAPRPSLEAFDVESEAVEPKLADQDIPFPKESEP